MLRKRRLFLPGRTGKLNPVYVDNLIDGILLAIEAQAHGEIFNITDGVAISYHRFFCRLAEIAGLTGPVVLPAPVMHVLVRLMTRLREVGLPVDDVGPDTVRTLLRPNGYSIDKARRVLGYTPRIALEQGFQLTRPFIEQELTRQAYVQRRIHAHAYQVSSRRRALAMGAHRSHAR